MKVKTIRGEAALLVILLINSFGVVLMMHADMGISPMSSFPYAIYRAFPSLSLGTWNLLFQCSLVICLLILQKKLILPYLISFAAGILFGVFVDVYNGLMSRLPTHFLPRIGYFCLSYLVLSFGIALSNRCGLPVLPTDLFPRDLSMILRLPYSHVKIPCDLICVSLAAGITLTATGHVDGVGIGTVITALTVGKTIEKISGWLDRHFVFVSVLSQRANRNGGG